MKKVLTVVLCVFCFCGCATVDIPGYVKDENPYKHKVYANFDQTLAATMETLDDFGWVVTKTTKPSVFEQGYSLEEKDQRIIILTETRKTSLFLASRYARINVLISRLDQEETEIELRYMTVNSVLFKTFRSYKKDAAVERMLGVIEDRLK